MPVEMRLNRIIISEINENQIVFLKEVEGDRQLPILIGIFEATSIDRRVKEIPRPRPLTHDLLVGCLLYTSPSPRDRQKSRMPSSA